MFDISVCCLFVLISADIGDTQSRLLDHRPVLQGEIRYFTREFEVRKFCASFFHD